MSPPAVKLDDRDLVALFLERLGRFEKSLSDMGATLARFEVLEKQAHAAIAQAQTRADRLDGRVSALEEVRLRAEGAAWLGKVLWVALAAVGGFALRYVVGR